MKRILTTLSQKWPEYLLEILVLIVGVYGAFELDSWGEDRNIRKSEKQILENLRRELLANEQELKDIQNFHAKSTECGIALLRLFHHDISDVPVDYIDSIFAFAETFNTFEQSDGYMKSIIASGKIDHLQNERLKAMITGFEGQVIDATQEGLHIQKLFHERLWPILDGTVSQAGRLKKYGFVELPESSYTSDYQTMFANKEVEDILMNIVGWFIEAQKDEQKLMNFIEEMLKIIEQDLQASST